MEVYAGLFVPAAFADKLSLLMSSRDLRINMGKAGIMASKRYEVTQIMPLWIKLFERLLHNLD